jgi:spore photoproduct lyase
MPEAESRLLDIRTDRIADRIAAIDDFVAAGYEVHVNLSPVVVRDGWLADWAGLLDDLTAGTGQAFEDQAAAEVIFLTHNEPLHQVKPALAPRGGAAAVDPRDPAGEGVTDGWPQRPVPQRVQGCARPGAHRTDGDRTPWLRVRFAF